MVMTVGLMLLSHSNALRDGRPYYPIGRITAASKWRPIAAVGEEMERLAAIQALVREAQEYDADAILDLEFHVDEVMRDDIDGAPLRRVTAKGIAVRFRQSVGSLALKLTSTGRGTLISSVAGIMRRRSESSL